LAIISLHQTSSVTSPGKAMYRRYIKRLLDLLVALVALVALAPTMTFIALLVRVKHGSPVLFKQQRPGLHGRPFTLYKFRTMTEATGPDGSLLPAAKRLTPFGRVLRSTSLDELPELWNLLRGDMSLVGPRPLLVDYLPLYTPEQARRHGVRPGVTGLAQISGRNTLSWENRFALDIWYVDHLSFLLDVKIILKTVQQVRKREGISPREGEIMPRFTGTAREGGKVAGMEMGV